MENGTCGMLGTFILVSRTGLPSGTAKKADLYYTFTKVLGSYGYVGGDLLRQNSSTVRTVRCLYYVVIVLRT